MKIAILLTIISCVINNSNASINCCAGENVLVNRTCTTGESPGKSLKCDSKYLLEERDVTWENNTLYLDTEQLSSERYCWVTNQETSQKMFLICMTDEILEQGNIKAIIFSIFLIISSVFMLLTIGIYILVHNALGIEGIIVIHSLSGMTVAYITLTILNLVGHIETIMCELLAYTMYIGFCYSFFWLNILSFHLWRIIVTMKSSSPRLLFYYYCYGICGPLILVSIVILAHKGNFTLFENINPSFGREMCWFPDLHLTFVYFYGPLSFLLLLNIIFYIWTLSAIFKQQLEETNVKKSQMFRFKIILCIKFFFIMGITWIFEIISAAVEKFSNNFSFLWIATDTLNGLQGVLIFLILVVFRKKVLRELASKKICNIRMPDSWRTAEDDECEALREEEISFSRI